MSSFKVPADFLPYLEDALPRLCYLHPETRPERFGDTVVIAPVPPATETVFQRDLYYALCRAKIHAGGQELRQRLFELAFGK